MCGVWWVVLGLDWVKVRKSSTWARRGVYEIIEWPDSRFCYVPNYLTPKLFLPFLGSSSLPSSIALRQMVDGWLVG